MQGKSLWGEYHTAVEVCLLAVAANIKQACDGIKLRGWTWNRFAVCCSSEFEEAPFLSGPPTHCVRSFL